MGICQSNTTLPQTEEFQSIMLPNEDLISTDEYFLPEPHNSFSQSKQDANQDIDIQTLQNYLNKHPLTKTLYLLYNKCRIERPIELEDGLYQGQWYCGKQCGFGRMFYKNKDYYEGYWLLGLKHHMGMFIKHGQQPLIGSWFADKYQGKEISCSIMKDLNLDIEYSNLLNQQIHQFPDSQFYGQIISSGKQGLGYWFKEGVFRYVGYFSNNKKNGYCVEVNSKESYRGYYKNGIRQGIGHLKIDKLLFIGQFENNQPTTNGIQIQI